MLYLWLTSKHNCPISLAARSHKTNSAWLIYGSNTTLTLHTDNDHETIGGIYIGWYYNFYHGNSILKPHLTWFRSPPVSCSNSHPTVTFDGDYLSRSNPSFYGHIGLTWHIDLRLFHWFRRHEEFLRTKGRNGKNEGLWKDETGGIFTGAHIIELKKVFENTLGTCDSPLSTIMNHLNMNNTNSEDLISRCYHVTYRRFPLHLAAIYYLNWSPQ